MLTLALQSHLWRDFFSAIAESWKNLDTTAFLAHRSRRLTKWAYRIVRLRCPSSVVVVVRRPHFWTIYIQDQSADFSQNLSVASLVWGKSCIRFWGRSGQNCGCHGNRKLPLTYNGKNAASAFSQSPLTGSLSNLQLTRIGIKSQMNSNLDRVGLLTTELFGLEHSHWLWMGKMVAPFFLS